MPIILFFAIAVFAQNSAPLWVEEFYRSNHYKNSDWYVGFAKGKIDGQPNNKDYEAIEKTAQNKLSESIVIEIQSAISIQNTGRQIKNDKKFSESSIKDYEKRIKTNAHAVLAKLDTKSHFDERTGNIYGFASVKKRDLANFYRTMINSMFNFAEKEFYIAEQLETNGKKNDALKKIEAIEDSLKDVDFWGFLLQAVENDNLYLEQEKEIRNKIIVKKNILQKRTVIYLEILKNGGYSDLAKKLSVQMYEKKCNCTIVTSKSKADFLVAIDAELERCTNSKDNFGQVFCYANASSAINNAKQENIGNVLVNVKGGWTNEDINLAKKDTFKQLVDSLAVKIIKTINQ